MVRRLTGASSSFVVTALLACCACDDDRVVVEPPSASVQVQGIVDACPIVTSATVFPSAARIGELVTATVFAMDKDKTDTLSYSWTAATGHFTEPTKSVTRYACAIGGQQTLTVKVSDGRCDTKLAITVTCQ